MSTPATDTTNSAAPKPVFLKRNRKAFMVALPVLLIGGAALYWLSGGRYEETDNANFHQARIAIASQLPGRVISVAIAENQTVHEGDLLFQIDPEPFRLALAQADAALASARLTVEQLTAAYQLAQTREKIATDEADYQRTELERRETLARQGVVSTSSLDEARHATQAASEESVTAHQAVISALAALGGDPDRPAEDHPAVRAATVARESALYNLERTEIRAPADGIIYQAASFKPGQFVAAGSTLFALVQTSDAWVEANFKETQLAHIRPGQSVEVTFDLFADRTFDGTVEAIGAGTGAEFSLLPAQNATGNWVKVTQRVPVRITLDAGQDISALRSGLSASVVVDTEQASHLAGLFSSSLVGNASAENHTGAQ